MEKLFYEAKASKAHLLVRPSTILPCFTDMHSGALIRLIVLSELGFRDTCPAEGQFVYELESWRHFVKGKEVGKGKFETTHRGIAEAVVELCNELPYEATLEIIMEERECPIWFRNSSWRQYVLVTFRTHCGHIEKPEQYVRVLMRRFAKAISRHAAKGK